jgi:hypothetical protein
MNGIQTWYTKLHQYVCLAEGNFRPDSKRCALVALGWPM